MVVGAQLGELSWSYTVSVAVVISEQQKRASHGFQELVGVSQRTAELRGMMSICMSKGSLDLIEITDEVK